MAKSNIGWTDEVWNPVTGCSRVSPGCEHCYAETLSLRRGWSKKPWTNQNAAENVVLHPDRLEQPLRWRSPRRVFVNSMSDLFHERIPDAFIAHAFAVMAAAYQHTFQVLTKRPERMRALLSREGFWTLAVLQGVEQWWGDRDLATADLGVSAPLSNVWLGVSVEDQRRADERIPILRETPAAVRWISVEPLLGPVDLHPHLGSIYAPGFNWAVVGGESGPGHRTMDLAWLRDIWRLLWQADIPLFVKQDSGPKPGKQGRIPDTIWASKAYPVCKI